ncbi:MAG: CehA/McbA family metallohydrolase [Sandaracinaceae bacterium]|nr:CehA/McbA family metallohydrolase [Sandaracinaceae bacterium]
MHTTRLLSPVALGLLLALPQTARAETVLDLDGTAPDGDETHFFVTFEVPADIAEIEVRHSSVASDNILDFGLEDPNGFRGWGGGNTEPAVVGLDRASRSYVPGPIPAGTWRVVVGKAQVNVLPAQYTLQVILRTAAETTLAAQPERAPYEDPGALAVGRRFYAGDFHVHSRESGDAHPTLDEIATVARANGLDFVVITDHNTHTALDFLNDAQARHPDLLFIPGVEFTTYAGHANAIGATTWVNHRVGVDTTIDDAAAAYRAQGALFSINHPALSLGDLCIGCAWNHDLPDEAIDGIEIMTGATTVAQMAFLRPSVALWDGLCARGRHVAALGGSDDHRAGEGTGTLDSPIGSPTTMVEADELSVAAILEGIRQRRTVVRITGMAAPMVELGAREGLVGDTVTARRAHLEVRVTGGQGRTLQLLKNGEPQGDAVAVDADPFTLSLEVLAPAEGEDRYRAEVVESRRQVTLTSHVYVRAPVGGGGCSVGMNQSEPAHGALRWAALALAAALALRVRRRRTGARGPHT